MENAFSARVGSAGSRGRVVVCLSARRPLWSSAAQAVRLSVCLSGLGQLAPGCPELRPASANQPPGPRWHPGRPHRPCYRPSAARSKAGRAAARLRSGSARAGWLQTAAACLVRVRARATVRVGEGERVRARVSGRARAEAGVRWECSCAPRVSLSIYLSIYLSICAPRGSSNEIGPDCGGTLT